MIQLTTLDENKDSKPVSVDNNKKKGENDDNNGNEG